MTRPKYTGDTAGLVFVTMFVVCLSALMIGWFG